MHVFAVKCGEQALVEKPTDTPAGRVRMQVDRRLDGRIVGALVLELTARRVTDHASTVVSNQQAVPTVQVVAVEPHDARTRWRGLRVERDVRVDDVVEVD